VEERDGILWVRKSERMDGCMREGVIGGEGRRENSEVVEGGVRRVRSGSTVVKAKSS